MSLLSRCPLDGCPLGASKWGGGGNADFIFMGAGIFLTKAAFDTLQETGADRALASEPPTRGRQEGLTPICSDFEFFPVFFRLALLPDAPLSFLSLFILEKGQENRPKNRDFLSLPNPKNPWKRRGKRSKKQGIPRKEKKQGIPKQKQGKEGQGPILAFFVLLAFSRFAICRGFFFEKAILPFLRGNNRISQG